MVKKRKSPYRHSVRRHEREGKIVHKYVRGEGDKPEIEKPRSQMFISENVGISPQVPVSSDNYDIKIKYGDRIQMGTVTAGDYMDAISGATGIATAPPMSIVIRKRVK